MEIQEYISGEPATSAFAQVWEAAAVQGKTIYDELVQKHRQQLDKEREKCDYAFSTRRRAIKRIGLPQVRDYRLEQLSQEERAWQEQMQQMAQVTPELQPLLLMQIKGDSYSI